MQDLVNRQSPADCRWDDQPDIPFLFAIRICKSNRPNIASAYHKETSFSVSFDLHLNTVSFIMSSKICLFKKLTGSECYKIWLKQFAVNKIKSMSVCRIKHKKSRILAFKNLKVYSASVEKIPPSKILVTRWVSFLDLEIIILNLSVFEKANY